MKNNKKKCEICKNVFSEHLLSLFILGDDPSRDLCPICALEKRNAIHGLPADAPFQGEFANILYRQAIEELKRNHKKMEKQILKPRKK